MHQPWVLRPGLGELSALFQEARYAGPGRTPVRVLLDGEVPTDISGEVERRFLPAKAEVWSPPSR